MSSKGACSIGKTQTALAYAWTAFENGINAVLWIDCETGLSVASSFCTIANTIFQLEGALQDDNSGHNRHLTLNWLRKTPLSWLMILDNVEDEELARDCWPVASHGSVLVTSRRCIVAFDVATDGLEIQRFSDEEGGRILRRLVNRPAYSEDEVRSSQKLSREVGGLGLALGVMAAQVRIRHKSFTKYVEFYRKFPSHVHEQTRTVGGQKYNRSLHTCWNTTFAHLGIRAATILAVLSLLGSDHIPEALFQPAPTVLPVGLEFVTDELELIQYEFRQHISSTQRQASFDAASALLYFVHPKQVNGASLRNESEMCKKYTQHVLMLCRTWETYRFTQSNLNFVELLTHCAWYLHESVAPEEQAQLMATALEACEDKNGEDYAHLCNTDACAEIEKGRSGKAFQLLDKCISIRTNLFGATYVETGHSYNNYGNCVLQAWASPNAARDAIGYYSKAIEIGKTQPPEEQLKWNFAYFSNLSRAQRLCGDYHAALHHVDLAEVTIRKVSSVGSHFDAT